MSLLDLAGQLLGGGQQSGGSQSLLNEVMSLVQNHPGGIGGLVSAFQQGGLGSIAQSWVGTGQNEPVSADQVQSVLGNDRISEMAAKLGISPADASSHLSQLLPGVIDHLTPGGQVPQAGGSLLDMGASLVKGFTTGR